MENQAVRLRDALEEEILTGRLAPGTRLEEQALAARFGVSRTPIREALIQLTASGLIAHQPRRGSLVAEIGPGRLVEMFEVMAEFEALAARQAARRARAGTLQRIEETHAAARRAAETGDADAYYYANEAFHAAIRDAAANGFLLEQADALQKRLRPYRRLQLRARDAIRASFDEHEAIVAAIREADGDVAGAAMRAHVTIQGNRFGDLLASLAPAR